MPIRSGHAGTSAIQGGPTPQHTDTKNVLVPDTTGHPQRFYDHALTGTAGLVAQGEHAQHLAGSFNVMTDWCMLILPNGLNDQ